MPTLKQALASFSQTLAAYPPASGQPTPELPTSGKQSALTAFGGSSAGTGSALTAKSLLNAIGAVHGKTGVTVKTAEEAELLLANLTTTLQPPCVQAWLTAMEQHSLVAASIPGKHPPAPPVLSPTECATVRETLLSLSEVLAPARNRGGELELTIGKMFAGYNLFTGDEAKLKAQIMVWAEELEGYPLYAIKKAYKWALRGDDKLPSLAQFIRDVKVAIGTETLARHKLLKQLVSSTPSPGG